MKITSVLGLRSRNEAMRSRKRNRSSCIESRWLRFQSSISSLLTDCGIHIVRYERVPVFQDYHAFNITFPCTADRPLSDFIINQTYSNAYITSVSLQHSASILGEAKSLDRFACRSSPLFQSSLSVRHHFPDKLILWIKFLIDNLHHWRLFQDPASYKPSIFSPFSSFAISSILLSLLFLLS